MSTPPPDAAHIARAREAIKQAVLSANGRPSFAREASLVAPRLFVSDVFTARTPDTLRALAITHVVSVLDADAVVLFPRELALATLHVPLADSPAADLLSHLPRTTEFIAAAMRDENARVLVHCWQGVSRSASVAAGFLIATENMTAVEAVELLKSKRRIVQPNTGFLRQLHQYEVLLRANDDADCSTK